MTDWTRVCPEEEIGPEGALRFDHAGRTYAVFRNHDGEFFCTDGLCTHEDVHLADGLVVENTIECPRHSSIFDFTTGEVETPPACQNLGTWPVRLSEGWVWIGIDGCRD